MTLAAATPLEQGMAIKPFNIIIDWTCQEAYAGKPGYGTKLVEVDLHIMDSDPRNLRRFESVARAVDWALHYLDSRGFTFLCALDEAQRHSRTRVVLHAAPKGTAIATRHIAVMPVSGWIETLTDYLTESKGTE